jgi:RNA polymerase primary sigma factor
VYLDDLARYPLLTRDQEVELSAIVQDAASSEDERQEALDRLVQSNLRLVVRICRDFTRNHFGLLDLVSVGNEGLIIAARKFEGTMGVPFANYAAYWIKQRVLKYQAEHGFHLRMPPYRAVIINKVVRIHTQLTQALGRAPSADEIVERVNQLPVKSTAKHARVTRQDVEEVLQMLQPVLELDAPMTDKDDASSFGAYFGETVSDASEALDARLQRIDLKREIGRALDALAASGTTGAREAKVLRMHYGLDGSRPMDLEAIAKELKVTRERARQIKNSGEKRLRETGALAADLM